MKKRNLKTKLSLGRQLVSNLETTEIKGGLQTDICTGFQETCGGCGLPTRFPCVRPTRGDWTCQGCGQQ